MDRKTIRMAVLAAYKRGFRGTADEVSRHLGLHPRLVCPRCTELKKEGFIARTGETRISPLGGTAYVLKAA